VTENINFCKAVEPYGWVTFDITPPSVECLQSFNQLSPDRYAENCNRSRLFSQFKAVCQNGGWFLEKLEHRPFVQSKEHNPHSGGISREFDPVEHDFSDLVLKCFEKLKIDSDQQYQLDLHQYRVEAKQALKGDPVPEGPHQDGHELVGIIVLKRQNVVGAENSLFHLGGEKFKELTLQENQCLFLEDGKMLHDATPIAVENLEEGDAYRDYVVININRWDNRRYGEDFERRALSL